ncbi:probable LRR receptor-like serine/threonine-protein kinase At1g74360 [Oryza brachyantha]|uniref:probable LRR receptor-like serine/threonine-protein kinase At1g74360 n=1 Tax=Oryza brachyantha TaxID=4533 RepID=UPI001ADADA3E|nr:probable LRR receptor-like serine/threonine-protein kinase At1g74360 [Oryza brachyantha]
MGSDVTRRHCRGSSSDGGVTVGRASVWKEHGEVGLAGEGTALEKQRAMHRRIGTADAPVRTDCRPFTLEECRVHSSENTTMSYQMLNALLLQALLIAHMIHGQSDKEVLLELKNYLQTQNPINHGAYVSWSENEASPCCWKGVGCDVAGHVNSLDLSNSNIAGPSFSGFSRLTGLTHLDLSSNSITGELQDDLKHCQSLQHLNISNNLIGGIFDLSNLINLRTLDVSQNRFLGRMDRNFPRICGNLTFLSVSSNSLTGRIDRLFDSCSRLKHVDLSWNSFTGMVWPGIERLRQFKANNNNLTGRISPGMFTAGCKLHSLNIAINSLYGSFPSSIGNCSNLKFLSVWGNSFDGSIPPGIGSVAGLEELVLASNSFDGDIPMELTNCTNLQYLDISDNNFGGEVQDVFGKLTAMRSLLLQENNYTGGITSSGILQLPNLIVLDLSYNQFSGDLPTEISSMKNIKVLMLAENNFAGKIPPTYGQLLRLQVLDLSFNSISGEIPPDIGNLSSLLLLMLAGNRISGEIPREIGNCTSLVWLNLAGNQLMGQIPPEIANMGRNPSPTFMENRKKPELLEAITSKCVAVEWIPSSYPEFNFVQSLMMSQKNCQTIWNRVAMGYDVLPISSPLRTALGYVQLSGNQLSGEIPSAIGTMRNLSLLLLDGNRLSGHLPAEIGHLQLVALNISSNFISGEIPSEIGRMDSLESLDLSSNNFSGALPSSLNQLTKLSRFNVSYNPLLSGDVPSSGQLSTFDEQSFLGDPLLSFHVPAGSSSDFSPGEFSLSDTEEHPAKEEIMVTAIAFLAFFLVTLIIREFHTFLYLYFIVSRKIANCRILQS